MTGLSMGLRAAGLMIVTAAALWVFIEREQDRANKWREMWRTTSAASASLSAQFDAMSSTGSSAQSRALAAASSAQARLSQLPQRSKVIRAEIVHSASSNPDLNRPLSPGLRDGLRSVVKRVCDEAAARSQDGVCARQGSDATGGEGAVSSPVP